MAKVLKCGDLMPGCNFVVEGKDVAEVMAKGAEHAKTAHGMTSIPPDVAAKVQAAIKDKIRSHLSPYPLPSDGGERDRIPSVARDQRGRKTRGLQY